MEGAWNTTAVIGTPVGDYECKSDNLTAEIQAAAKMANLRAFYVNIRHNGESKRIGSSRDLHTNSVSALVDQINIEDANEKPEVASVAPYDKAA